MSERKGEKVNLQASKTTMSDLEAMQGLLWCIRIGMVTPLSDFGNRKGLVECNEQIERAHECIMEGRELIENFKPEPELDGDEGNRQINVRDLKAIPGAIRCAQTVLDSLLKEHENSTELAYGLKTLGKAARAIAEEVEAIESGEDLREEIENCKYRRGMWDGDERETRRIDEELATAKMLLSKVKAN